MTTDTISNELHALQRAKERYGPSYEACFEQAEYREAAWRVVEVNTPLIHWTVGKLGLQKDHDDLSTSMKITMFLCCYHWEPSRGAFSTYAVASMRKQYLRTVGDLIQQDRPLPLPANLRTEKTRQFQWDLLEQKAVELLALREEAERNETMDEWWAKAERLKRRVDTVRRAADVDNIQSRHIHRFRDSDGIPSGEVSEVMLLPHPDVDVEREALDNVIADNVVEAVKEVLEPYPRLLLVLQLRYAIDFGMYEGDLVVHTLEQCGTVFRLSRERIRQMEAKAIRLLRRREHGITTFLRV